MIQKENKTKIIFDLYIGVNNLWLSMFVMIVFVVVKKKKTKTMCVCLSEYNNDNNNNKKNMIERKREFQYN